MALSNPFTRRRDDTVLDWREHPGTTELLRQRREAQTQIRDLELETAKLELARITAAGDLVEAEGRHMLGHIGDAELAAASTAAEQARLAVHANGVQITDAKAALARLLQVADPVYRGAIEDVNENVHVKHRALVERVDRAYADLLEANSALLQLEGSVMQQDSSIEREYGPTAERPRLHVPQSALLGSVDVRTDQGYRYWRRNRVKAGALPETKDERANRERLERAQDADRRRENKQRSEHQRELRESVADAVPSAAEQQAAADALARVGAAYDRLALQMKGQP